MSTVKKIDRRVRDIIENGITLNYRSFIVLVGRKGRDHIVKLHYILSKATVSTRPSVLWCYKDELGFATHYKKRMKKIKKKIKAGYLDPEHEDPFELFLTATDIRFAYYKETHKVLGNTYGMCVLQDFEAITPNIMARTIETVQGGGLVVLLLNTIDSIKQLYSMAMDEHVRFRTDSFQDVVPRFNERFLLSLVSCKQCLILDDQMNVLPITVASRNIAQLPKKKTSEELENESLLKELKESLRDTEPFGSLLEKAKTLDQGKAIVAFIYAIADKSVQSTVAITAGRGRGKSAALGISIAAAVALGYSNIFVTSPSPENLKTLFEFIFVGLNALDYKEHLDYEIIESIDPEMKNVIVRVNIYREHRQVIEYISPADHFKLGQAELLVIDEAAAIPLPYVKKLLGPYLVFLSSTVNGYEGTGRSLSLKLMKQLKERADEEPDLLSFVEASLQEPIRYASGDDVESWLNGLLCLDATIPKSITLKSPPAEACELYYVNRDALFSYHSVTEDFLHQMMSLYVSSHYKNSPNDLMLMSDAPAHSLFVLLPKIDENTSVLPDILCVVQVSIEGAISKEYADSLKQKGLKPSGDLIPWNISNQFQDNDFVKLSGARIVRIATHPNYQKNGYGSRAVQQLQSYYEGRFYDKNSVKQQSTPARDPRNVIQPRRKIPPLLSQLSEREPESLNYIAVSYGLTEQLYNFWSRNDFLPLYLRLTALDVTGEHTCIMLKKLNLQYETEIDYNQDWLCQFNDDFANRFISLLGFEFKKFPIVLAENLLAKKRGDKIYWGNKSLKKFNHADVKNLFSVSDLKRLEAYGNHFLDYHAIIDLIPKIATVYFAHNTPVTLSPVQRLILIGFGLQHKEEEALLKELRQEHSKLISILMKIVKKFQRYFLELDPEAKQQKTNQTKRKLSQLNPTEENPATKKRKISKRKSTGQAKKGKRKSQQ